MTMMEFTVLLNQTTERTVQKNTQTINTKNILSLQNDNQTPEVFLIMIQ
jgi:hypothetical protein